MLVIIAIREGSTSSGYQKCSAFRGPRATKMLAGLGGMLATSDKKSVVQPPIPALTARTLGAGRS